MKWLDYLFSFRLKALGGNHAWIAIIAGLVMLLFFLFYLLPTYVLN